MIESIKRVRGRFNDKNFLILGFELFLFSALYGIAFRSWVIFLGIFLILFLLLNKIRETTRMICVLSLLWGFIAFSIGHSISWSWATILGTIFFLLGIGIHLRELKKPLVNKNNFEWQRSGYQGRKNLN